MTARSMAIMRCATGMEKGELGLRSCCIKVHGYYEMYCMGTETEELGLRNCCIKVHGYYEMC